MKYLENEMPWAQTAALFKIPQMHWVEDLMANVERLFYYFDNADLPKGWRLIESNINCSAEDTLLFSIDHMPTQEEYARVEQFILTGE